MFVSKLKLIGFSVLAIGLAVTVAAASGQQGSDRGQTSKSTTDPNAQPGPSQVERIRELIRKLDTERERLLQALVRAELDLPARAPQYTKALDQEHRLQNIEQKLDQLLTARGPVAGLPVPAVLPEDRVKNEAWLRLMRDGFICRLDAEEVNWVQFLTRLYRHYLDRRPSKDETAVLEAFCGPGWEQAKSEPELLVRRLLRSDAFASSPLGRALLSGQKSPMIGDFPRPVR